MGRLVVVFDILNLSFLFQDFPIWLLLWNHRTMWCGGWFSVGSSSCLDCHRRRYSYSHMGKIGSAGWEFGTFLAKYTLCTSISVSLIGNSDRIGETVNGRFDVSKGTKIFTVATVGDSPTGWGWERKIVHIVGIMIEVEKERWFILWCNNINLVDALELVDTVEFDNQMSLTMAQLFLFLFLGFSLLEPMKVTWTRQLSKESGTIALQSRGPSTVRVPGRVGSFQTSWCPWWWFRES